MGRELKSKWPFVIALVVCALSLSMAFGPVGRVCFLIFCSVLAGQAVLTWWAWSFRRGSDRREALEFVERAGGAVTAFVGTERRTHGVLAVTLAGTEIQDQDLASLQGLPHLKELDLAHTGITDAGLEQLAEFAALEELDLAGTGVTDAGLVHLEELPQLSRLGVQGTQTTEVGLSELAAAIPGLVIDGGDVSWEDGELKNDGA